MDNIVLIQEEIHSRKSRGDKGMVIKLDLANTFDKVRHSLFSVLRGMEFVEDFLKWVKSCISSPWIAPLVNSSFVGLF